MSFRLFLSIYWLPAILAVLAVICWIIAAAKWKKQKQKPKTIVTSGVRLLLLALAFTVTFTVIHQNTCAKCPKCEMRSVYQWHCRECHYEYGECLYCMKTIASGTNSCCICETDVSTASFSPNPTEFITT